MIQLSGCIVSWCFNFLDNNKLMKTLESNKSIESIERKPTRKFKQLPHILQPQAVSYSQPQELIFKAQILPVSIQLQSNQLIEMTLTLTQTAASLKYDLQTSTVPLHLGKARWLRLTLGQQIRKADLKASYNQNSIHKQHVFTNLSQWKAVTAEDPKSLDNISLPSLLKLVKGKLQKADKKTSQLFKDRSQIPPKDKKGSLLEKSSIGSFIKSRLSERHTFRMNIAHFRGKHETAFQQQPTSTEKNGSLEALDRRQNNTFHHQHQVRKTSSTLQPEKVISLHHLPNQMKESNTSTSISYEPEIKIPKRTRRIRDAVESKGSKPHYQGGMQDLSEIFPLKQQRPRFYQHINMSQEQIDLKRKKFDSQFISKKPTFPQTTKEIAAERNESEVTEDIIKVQNSQSLQRFDDTLEKGFMENNVKTNKEIEQSGTLYESVYE